MENILNPCSRHGILDVDEDKINDNYIKLLGRKGRYSSLFIYHRTQYQCTVNFPILAE